MWNLRIVVSVPTARDLEHLADIAGTLVEDLEEAAGELGPVVSGHFTTENPHVRITVDATSEDPTMAVSTTLELIHRVAKESKIPLGQVQAISLSISDETEVVPELASA